MSDTTTDVAALLDHVETRLDPSPSSLGPARFAGADLRDANLTGRDLRELDLTGADLRGASLVNADLSGAILHGATLDGASLIGATLDGADLSDASCRGITAGGAHAHHARLTGATLDDSSLTQIDLRHARLGGASLRNVRLRDADLRHVDAYRADFSGADLEHADVAAANFRDSTLTGTRLRNVQHVADADWIGITLLDIDFTGAYLIRREIVDQNYLYEFRNQGRQHEWIYRAWKLTSDCGRSFGRWALLTFSLALLFSFLYLLVNVDYGDYRTPISPLYYSLVTMTTLGYGDVLPASGPAQVIALAEVVTGYFMLGGLLGIFANKMSRRAD